MSKTPVLHSKHASVALPVMPTAVTFLLLDRFHAAGWVWGAVGVLMVLAWIGAIVRLCRVVPRSPLWSAYDP